MQNTLLITIISVLGFGVVTSVPLAMYISGIISSPLIILNGFLKRAGEHGDTEIKEEDVKSIGLYGTRRDETGQTIASTANFVTRINGVNAALEKIAGGDLTAEFAPLSDKDTLGKSLKKMTADLNAMFGSMNNSANQVSAGASQVADSAQSLAQGTTQQAATVEQLSSSITEIAARTKHNAEMAGKAASLAETIKVNAEKGTAQMDEMMSAVKQIQDASRSIDKVMKTIDDIAFQTNILALNAAVEAARAGQHGKGFAVVAEEVRNLASKSAEAARETGSLIANSIEKAELGAQIAEETSASLAEIVTGVNDSSRLVAEIAKEYEAQSEGIALINNGIDQVAQVVQQNSATAEESAAASEEMSSQSALLRELIAKFKLQASGVSSHENAIRPVNRPAAPQSAGFAINEGYEAENKYIA